MGQIVGTNTLSFNKDKLTQKGTGYVKSSHIAVEWKIMIVSRVLIDNGSLLIAYPIMTLGSIDSTIL